MIPVGSTLSLNPVRCLINFLCMIRCQTLVYNYTFFCADIIRQPESKEDEIHNCQSVIDALSMDVLHTSLSHITGESIHSGELTSVGNLLEVFSGLLEYILNRIESDVSTDNDDDGDIESKFDL